MDSQTTSRKTNHESLQRTQIWRLPSSISLTAFVVVLCVVILHAGIVLGVIKFAAFWTAFSINPLDYMTASDLRRGSSAPWLFSIGYGLLFLATLFVPRRVTETSSPLLRIFKDNHSGKIATAALYAIPFLLYIVVILNLPNHGMLARSPVFSVFLMCLFGVIWADATPVTLKKLLIVSLATFAMIAWTEGMIARTKACDRVQAGELQSLATDSDTKLLPKAGHTTYLGSLKLVAFEYENQANSVAVFEPASGIPLSRINNVVPKCAYYLKHAEK